MCGAASVFGVLRAIAELKAKVNVIGSWPPAKTAFPARATKPGDVVTSLSDRRSRLLIPMPRVG